MKRIWILALIAACGDNGGSKPHDAPIADAPVADGSIDGAVDAPIDAAIDAPIDAPGTLTFTQFVIDQVTNHTSSTTDPVPHATYSGLADPDTNNPAAYSSLFP